MTKPVPWILGIIGVVFIGVALVYWLTPAGGLPSFLPGFDAGSDHVHLTHALGSLIIALALFAIAIIWFQLISERLAEADGVSAVRLAPVGRPPRRTLRLSPNRHERCLLMLCDTRDAGTVRAWT